MFSNPTSKKSNITEANKHLHLLYDRISELERMVEEQASLMTRKDEEHQEQVATVLALKESETTELSSRLEASESLVQELQSQIDEKNTSISELQQKSRVLDEIFSFKPMLEKMLFTMTYGSEGQELQHVSNGAQSSCSGEHTKLPFADVSQTACIPSDIELSLDWPKPQTDATSPTSPILEMANQYKRNGDRQFSISNADDEDNCDDDSPDDY